MSSLVEAIVNLPFHILVQPNIKLKRPAWLHLPSAMTVYGFVLVSYFLVCGGVIYDIIIEPPAIGSEVDRHGHSRPVAFMRYRINGQYIMEGLASSFFFTLGAIGFIFLDKSRSKSATPVSRMFLISTGFIFIVVSFFLISVFMRMKLPGYLQ